MVGRLWTLLLAAACGWVVSAQPLLLHVDAPEFLDTVTVRTAAAGIEVRPAPLEPSRDIVAAVLADTLAPDSLPIVKAGLLSLYAKAPQRLTLALFASGQFQSAGPFRTRAQFQEALGELPAAPADGLGMTGARYYTLLGEAAAKFPSDWRTVVLIARPPALDPALAEYAVAYLAARFRAAPVRAAYWSPGGERSDLLDALVRETGAPAITDISLPPEAPSAGGYLELSWPPAERRTEVHRSTLKACATSPDLLA